MTNDLFKNEVVLEPLEHKYFDSNGLQYLSFSKLYEKLVKKFDAEMVSRNIAKNSDETFSEILAKWNQTALNGTRIDNALELYAQTGKILESDNDLRYLLPTVLDKYMVYKKTYEQGTPYSKKYRVAGSWDKLSLVTNRSDSRFHISDFKCFEKGYDSLFKTSGQQFLNYPFEHLANNKFTKISFQLSFYAHLVEELTGRKCEKLFIDLITPVFDENNVLLSFKNEVVHTMYLKNDVITLLETFKDEILIDLSNQTKTESVYNKTDCEIF